MKNTKNKTWTREMKVVGVKNNGTPETASVYHHVSGLVRVEFLLDGENGDPCPWFVVDVVADMDMNGYATLAEAKVAAEELAKELAN